MKASVVEEIEPKPARKSKNWSPFPLFQSQQPASAAPSFSLLPPADRGDDDCCCDDDAESRPTSAGSIGDEAAGEIGRRGKVYSRGRLVPSPGPGDAKGEGGNKGAGEGKEGGGERGESTAAAASAVAAPAAMETQLVPVAV
jgi:hypothetical protein